MVVVTPPFRSIYSITDRIVIPDGDSKSIIAIGDPRELKESSAGPPSEELFSEKPSRNMIGKANGPQPVNSQILHRALRYGWNAYRGCHRHLDRRFKIFAKKSSTYMRLLTESLQGAPGGFQREIPWCRCRPGRANPGSSDFKLVEVVMKVELEGDLQ